MESAPTEVIIYFFTNFSWSKNGILYERFLLRILTPNRRHAFLNVDCQKHAGSKEAWRQELVDPEYRAIIIK